MRYTEPFRQIGGWIIMLALIVSSASSQDNGSADLAIEAQVSDARPQVGQPVVLTVAVANRGPDDSSGAVISVPLPSGLAFVSSQLSQGEYLPAEGLWNLGDLAAGDTAMLDLTARVQPGEADPAGSGAFLGTLVETRSGGLLGPVGVIFGPDGDLYVSSSATDQVLRYDGSTGNFRSALEPGNLDFPTDLVFGPDGRLYVANRDADGVLRYDVNSEGSPEIFVSSGSGGLNRPAGLEFGPDGDLYASGFFSHNVVRYDGRTGAPRGEFVSAGSGGLDRAGGLAFGPDGDLYVASNLTRQILRYDGTTGEFLDVFVTSGSGGLDQPADIEFGPDGNLYVASFGTNSVLRYDGRSGFFLGAFPSADSGGLDQPLSLTFGVDGHLYVPSFVPSEVLRFDGFITGTARVVAAEQADPNRTNDLAAAGIDYRSSRAPDLRVVSRADREDIAPGELISYTLDYANHGTEGTRWIALLEIVPDHTTFEAAASHIGWECIPDRRAGSLCFLLLSGLEPGGGSAVTFTVSVDSSLPPGLEVIHNLAVIIGDESGGVDANPADNISESDTAIVSSRLP